MLRTSPIRFFNRWTRVEALESRRLLAAGSLDPSFSGDGKTTVDFGVNTFDPYHIVATDVAVQPDGKTVVAGTFRPVDTGSDHPRSFAVVRFNLDGTLDRTLRADTTHRGLDFAHPGTDDSVNDANAVAIAPSGGILVVGRAEVDTLGFNKDQFAVVSFNPDGSHGVRYVRFRRHRLRERRPRPVGREHHYRRLRRRGQRVRLRHGAAALQREP
jgi:uncharacterized delta-60 repeat protein